MFGNNSRPKWWLLYLLVPAMVGLFMLEGSEPLSNTGHRVVEIAIVFATFGLVALWLRSNEAGIRREQWTDYKRTTYTSAGRLITIRRMNDETIRSVRTEAADAIDMATEQAMTVQKRIQPVAQQDEKLASSAETRMLSRADTANLTQ